MNKLRKFWPLAVLPLLLISCSHPEEASSSVSEENSVSSSFKKLSKTEMWTAAYSAILAYRDTLTTLEWNYSANNLYSYTTTDTYWEAFDLETKESISSDGVYEAVTKETTHEKTASASTVGKVSKVETQTTQAYEQEGVLRYFIDDDLDPSSASYCEWELDGVHSLSFIQTALRDSAIGMGKALYELESYPHSYYVVAVNGAAVKDYALLAHQNDDGSFYVEMSFGIDPLPTDIENGPFTEDYKVTIDAAGNLEEAKACKDKMTTYGDLATLTSHSEQTFKLSAAAQGAYAKSKNVYSAARYPTIYAAVPAYKDMTALPNGSLTGEAALPYLLSLGGYSDKATSVACSVTLPQDASLAPTAQLYYSLESTCQAYQGDYYEESGTVKSNIAMADKGTTAYKATPFTQNYTRTTEVKGFNILRQTITESANLYIGPASTSISAFSYPSEVISLNLSSVRDIAQISPTSLADPYSLYSLEQIKASDVVSATVQEGLLTIAFHAYCGTEGKTNTLTVEIKDNRLMKTSFVKEDDLYSFDDLFHTTTTVYSFAYDPLTQK
jgi:hypothetical protein